MREIGYYWVKYFEEWIIASYELGLDDSPNHWYIPGGECTLEDNEFNFIDERKITNPNEQSS